MDVEGAPKYGAAPAAPARAEAEAEQPPRLPRVLEVGLLSLMLCSLALAAAAGGRAVGNHRAHAAAAALYTPLGMDDDAGVDDDLTRPDDYVSNGKAEKTAKALRKALKAAYTPLGMDDDAGVDDDLTRPDDYVSNGKDAKTAAAAKLVKKALRGAK